MNRLIQETSLATVRRPILAGMMGLGALFLVQCGDTTPTVDLSRLVTVNNTQPVARTVAGGEVPVGASTALDGTPSYDPDGDEITYHWEVESLPEGSNLGDSPFSLNGDRNSSTTYVSPDVPGAFIFGLYVIDTAGYASAKDYLILDAKSALDLPVADAGPNVSGLEGDPICLDGSNSHDSSGAELNYTWTLVSTPDASALSSADLQASDAEVCMTGDAPGTYTVALVVNNELADSEPDFAFVSVGSTNQGPTAVAEVVEAASCSYVQVSGESSTDPEGDALNYNWDLLLTPAGSGLELGSLAFDDHTSMAPTFYADLEGEYTLQLVVDDGETYSMPVFLEIDLEETKTNEPPLVVTSPDAYYAAPSPTCSVDAYGNCDDCPNCPSVTLQLDATQSSDPDGDLLTYSWEVLSGPTNAAVSSEEGDAVELVVPGPPGSCTATVSTHQVQVQVTATDCVGASSTGLVTVVYDCGI